MISNPPMTLRGESVDRRHLDYDVTSSQGRSFSLSAFAKHIGVDPAALHQRVRRGRGALSIGTHQQAFMDIVNDMLARRARKESAGHLAICVLCHGQGKLDTRLTPELREHIANTIRSFKTLLSGTNA